MRIYRMPLIALFLALFIAGIGGCQGCNDSSSGASAGLSATTPVVSSTNPLNLATDVAVNRKVSAVFSEEMDPLTITSLTFTMAAPDGTLVPGEVSYSGVTAVFTPPGNLEFNTLYTATITIAATDLAGNAMAGSYVWSFTTGTTVDTTAPTVTGTLHVNGATGVYLNTKVGATFSEDMNPATITDLTFRLESPVGTPVAGTVSYSGVSVVFIPSSDLAANTLYTVTVKGGADGVMDLAGNPLAEDFVISWTTGTISDSTAPTVTSTINANGATDVALNTHVGATFSEGMDPLTITNVTFRLESPVGTPVLGTVNYSGVNAVFIPASSLTASTLYTATITTAATDLAGNAMAGNYVWSWTTGSVADTTSPTVTGTVNADGATGVSLNTKPGATFSEGMDPLTITNLTFKLESPVGTPVSGTVSYSGVNVIFVPSSNLAANTLYTVTVTTGVKDLAGNAMASNDVSSWTTGATLDTTAPTVTMTNPADADTNVAINKKVTATFSEGMNPSTMTTANYTVTGPGITPVTGSVAYDLVSKIATFTPASNFAPDTTFTATVSTVATDLAGNAMASNKVWSWTTGATPDTTAPTVTVTNPADADTNVAINKKVTATFSEGMDPLTITTANYTVTGPGITPVTGTVAYDAATKIATFTPGSSLAPDTLFTATVSTVAKDLAGNPIASNKVWTFTTGAEAAQTVIQSPVPLVSSSNFAILASAAITNIATSHITGDVGLTPDAGSNISGFSVPATCPEITGKMYVVDATGPACALIDPTILDNAKLDAKNAFDNARAAVRGTPTAISGNLNGLTLYPGLYESGSSLEISPGGFLYLDAQGDGNAVFIIRSATSITTEASSEVVLTKGAKANNVYWTAGSTVTLGTNSIMKGTLIAGTALSLLTGADLEGRALNQGPAAEAITLDSCTITVPLP